MKLFDGYVAVDWSASSKPTRGENSIWLAVRGTDRTVEYENPATRQEAVEHIETLLRTATAAGRRLLCGFDFPFGYPDGTAQALPGRTGWEAVWSRVAELIEDDQRNGNNRFKAAARLNAHFDGDGPFWDNGLNEDIPGLPRNKPCVGWGASLPPNRRYAELQVQAAQEVWKLSGIGSVTGDTALRLGHFFGTSAEFWLNLQKLYELRLAEETAGKGIRALPKLKDLTSSD